MEFRLFRKMWRGAANMNGSSENHQSNWKHSDPHQHWPSNPEARSPFGLNCDDGMTSMACVIHDGMIDRDLMSRSQSCEMYQVQKLSPPTFKVGSGKCSLILIVQTNVQILSGRIFFQISHSFGAAWHENSGKLLFDTMFGMWNLCKGEWWRGMDGISGQMSKCTIK